MHAFVQYIKAGIMKTVACFLEHTFLLRADYTCVFYTAKDLPENELFQLSQEGYALQTNCVANVMLANNIGMPRERVFFDAQGKSTEELASVFEKCLYIVSSLEEISVLNSVAGAFLLSGQLEAIAIRLHPTIEGSSADALGNSKEQIAKLAAALRKAEHIAVKGVFVCLSDSGKVSSELLKQRFSLVKDFRSYLPCTLSYFCFESLLESLSEKENNTILESLEMISALNDSSLYAQFLLS